MLYSSSVHPSECILQNILLIIRDTFLLINKNRYMRTKELPSLQALPAAAFSEWRGLLKAELGICFLATQGPIGSCCFRCTSQCKRRQVGPCRGQIVFLFHLFSLCFVLWCLGDSVYVGFGRLAWPWIPPCHSLRQQNLYWRLVWENAEVFWGK